MSDDDVNKQKGRRPPHPLCGAQKRTDVDKCKKPAGWGTDHVGFGKCKLHGGSSPSGRLFAMKLQAAAEGKGMGDPVNVDPRDVLVDTVRMCAGTVLWLQRKISGLTEDELVEDTEQGLRGAVWVRLHGEYTDRLARVSKLAIDAGVQERQVRIAEEQGVWLMRSIDLLLAQLVLTPEQERGLPVIMGRVIEQLESGVIDVGGEEVTL